MRVLPSAPDAPPPEDDRKNLTGGAAVEADARPRTVFPRIPCLDGVRAVAVLTIIVHHAFLGTPLRGSSGRIDSVLDQTFGFGFLGVDLFFVLSGYLITSILDRTRDSGTRYQTFYARRFLRIFPLYYGFLVFSQIFLRWLGPHSIGTPASQLWQWTYLTNAALAFKGHDSVGSLYVPYWSLSIEEHFYLLWPLLVFAMGRAKLIRTSAWLAAASMGTAVVLGIMGHGAEALLLTPTHMQGLLLGGCVALLQQENPQLLTRIARGVVFSASLILPIEVLVFGGQAGLGVLTYYLTASPVFAAVIALLVLGRWRPLARALSAAPMRSIGKYSYAMYVLHVPILQVMGALGVPYWHTYHGYYFPYRVLTGVVLAMLSFAAAFGSWHLWEKRFLAFAPAYRLNRGAPAPPEMIPAAP